MGCALAPAVGFVTLRRVSRKLISAATINSEGGRKIPRAKSPAQASLDGAPSSVRWSRSAGPPAGHGCLINPVSSPRRSPARPVGGKWLEVTQSPTTILSLTAAQRNATGDARLIRMSVHESGLTEGAQTDVRVLTQISMTKPATTAASPATPSFRSFAHEAPVVICRHSASGQYSAGRGRVRRERNEGVPRLVFETWAAGLMASERSNPQPGVSSLRDSL